MNQEIRTAVREYPMQLGLLPADPVLTAVDGFGDLFTGVRFTFNHTARPRRRATEVAATTSAAASTVVLWSPEGEPIENE